MKDLTDYSQNLEDTREATGANWAARQALLAHASGSTAFGASNDRLAYGGRVQGSTPMSTRDLSMGDTPRDVAGNINDAMSTTPRAVTDLGANTPQ